MWDHQPWRWKPPCQYKCNTRQIPQHASLLPGGVISRPENTYVLLAPDLFVRKAHPELQENTFVVFWCAEGLLWTELRALSFRRATTKKIKWQQLSLPGDQAWPFFFYTTLAPAGSNNDQDPTVCNFMQNTSHVTREIFCSEELIAQINKPVTGENLDKVISPRLKRVVIETAAVLLHRDLFSLHIKWDLSADKW